jgi:hypothetical protein
MAQIANIIVNDGTTPTPVSRTFEPLTSQNGFTAPAEWLEKSNGVMSGFRRMSLLVKPRVSNVKTKTTIQIVVPYQTVVNGQTVWAPSPNRVNISFDVQDDSSDQDKLHLLAFARNLLANQVITDAVKNMSPAY